MKTPFNTRTLRMALSCVALSFATPAFADEEPSPPAPQEEAAADEKKAEPGEANQESAEEAKEEPAVVYRKVKTKGFTVELPEPWFERTTHRRAGKRPAHGRWFYTSPKRGYVLQLNVEPDVGTFADQAKGLQERALANLTNSRIVKADSFVEPSAKIKKGRQVDYAILRGDKVDRTGKTQRYHALVMVSRSYGRHKRMISMRLFAADRKVQEFLDIAEHIVKTFKIAP